MEVELIDAVALYQENIGAVRDSLAADPENAELQELLKELEEALASTQQALEELQPSGPGVGPGTLLPHIALQGGGGPAQPAAEGGGPAAAELAAAAEEEDKEAAAEDKEAAAAGGPIGPQLPPPAAAGGRGAAARPGIARPLGPGGVGGGGREMHPRNKYASEAPDFAALAEDYPSLKPYLRHRGPGSRPTIDFTSGEACRELTRVLLKHDYGVEWWVPLGQLVPPLTNRANYIHWLEDLLALSCPPGEVVGLDVGCGANLIYPLLGAALEGWHFVGVDVTEAALEWAESNRRSNPHLAHLIEVRRAAMQPAQHAMLSMLPGGGAELATGGGTGGRGQVQARPAKRARWQEQQEAKEQQPAQEQVQEEAEEQQQEGPQHGAQHGAQEQQQEGEQGCSVAQQQRRGAAQAGRQQGSAAELGAAGAGILSGAVRPGEHFAFCMCNPPFFESMDEAGRNPSTAFAGTAAEMVYPGGELAFVTSMVEDSLALGDQIHWYTTMVGKKGTMKALRMLLYRHGVKVLRTTEFVQGKTSRWAVAWSLAASPSVNQMPLPRQPPAPQFF